LREWLLFNDNSAIFQLYHGEKKLIFIDMMMKSALLNRIGGVIVSALPSSMVDREFEPRSVQIKNYEIGICCFPAKHAD
jgi:hypothetical protein